MTYAAVNTARATVTALPECRLRAIANWSRCRQVWLQVTRAQRVRVRAPTSSAHAHAKCCSARHNVIRQAYMTGHVLAEDGLTLLWAQHGATSVALVPPGQFHHCGKHSHSAKQLAELPHHSEGRRRARGLDRSESRLRSVVSLHRHVERSTLYAVQIGSKQQRML